MSSDALRPAARADDGGLDLDAVVDRSYVGDVGITSSAELLAFTNAVHDGSSDLVASRCDLERAVGPDGLFEAAATIAIFNGLVRVADGTGIRLDDGLSAFSADDRARLGLDSFAGAANTDGSVAPRDVHTITELFG